MLVFLVVVLFSCPRAIFPGISNKKVEEIKVEDI